MIINGKELLSTANNFLIKKEETPFGLLGISTGFKNLDKITHGFQNGHLIVVNNYTTGEGSFLFSLLHRLAFENQTVCALFSSIYKELFVGLNLMRYKNNVKYSKIINTFYSKEEYEQVKNHVNQLLNEEGIKNVLYNQLYDEDAEQICKLIADLQKEEAFKNAQKRVIFVDSVRYEDCKLLKNLAQELGVPIVVFLKNEKRSSVFSDIEIEFHKYEEISYNVYSYNFQVSNKELLTCSEYSLYLDPVNGFFKESLD